MSEEIAGVPLDEANRLLTEEDPEDWPEDFHERIAPFLEKMRDQHRRTVNRVEEALAELPEEALPEAGR